MSQVAQEAMKRAEDLEADLQSLTELVKRELAKQDEKMKQMKEDQGVAIKEATTKILLKFDRMEEIVTRLAERSEKVTGETGITIKPESETKGQKVNVP